MPLEYACSPNPEVCAVFKLPVPARHASDLPAAFVITQTNRIHYFLHRALACSYVYIVQGALDTLYTFASAQCIVYTMHSALCSEYTVHSILCTHCTV